MMKNAFYFTSKALFVLKLFKCFSWLFGHVAKRLDKKDKVNFTFYDVATWLAKTIVIVDMHDLIGTLVLDTTSFSLLNLLWLQQQLKYLFPLSQQYTHRYHCVKSVRNSSYSGPHFPAFGLNMDRYSVSLRIQSECGKIRTRITPNTDTFYTVYNCRNLILV